MSGATPGRDAGHAVGRSSGSAPLRVEADLTIDVDGTGATLTSDGDRLTLASPRPERLWATAVGAALPAGFGSVNGPRGIGRLADELSRAGLTLDVTGPHGSVVQLGRGVESRLGRAVTGSAAVAPGDPVALGVLVWQRVPTLAAVAAAGVVATTVGAVLRRTSRSRRS